jgi:hypothetical protein
MRQNVCISLQRELIDYIDTQRGFVPRSRVLESLIEKGIACENHDTPAGKIRAHNTGPAEETRN